MCRLRVRRLLARQLACYAVFAAFSHAEPWRSSLYPEDWAPGFADAAGRFLHDFSYAGYHAGNALPKELPGRTFVVTEAPYSADPTGRRDSTEAIQRALDAAAVEGGIVYLPPGEYRVAPLPGSPAALRIEASNVLLRGAGADKTRLFNATYKMRNKQVVRVGPGASSSWFDEDGELVRTLSADAANGATEIAVKDASAFEAGDLVALRCDLTQRFIDDVEMTGKWQPTQASPGRTPVFFRRIVAVQPKAGVLVVDVPLRYPLLLVDNARVVRVRAAVVREVGVEDFSIGMLRHPDSRLAEEDWGRAGEEGAAAYDVHNATAVLFTQTEHCWARRLGTYAPAANDCLVHLSSNGIKVTQSRFVTIEQCSMAYPHYRGGGGNGYLYCLNGQETLVRGCRAVGGRHNFDFGTMAASGNVVTRCETVDGKLASDFHMFLSMGNLLDNVTCDGDFLEARHVRPWGGTPIHGVTTTQSVFWNTCGKRYSRERDILVYSHQVGEGYVIGTRGPACAVDSSDFVEGEARGDTLVPASLYEDQVERRRVRDLASDRR